jgi:hypothetical protein
MTPRVEQGLTAQDAVLVIEMPVGLMKPFCQPKRQPQRILGEHVEELSPK